jgi:polysaccharide deacetylase family protein (PEP-CTERM system associated)
VVHHRPRAAHAPASAFGQANPLSYQFLSDNPAGSNPSVGPPVSERSSFRQLVGDRDVDELPRLNAFTVDVEDYFHVSGFERDISRASWPRFRSRVRESNRRILTLLGEYGVQATFYVLGWVARNHPEVVHDIVAEGHEVGTHSYWHRLVYEQTPRDFRKDLRDSRKLLEDLTGTRVRSYRAPSFSITSRSLWALEILAEEGIQIDSSIFPVRHDRYGIPNAPRKMHFLKTQSGRLLEFPSTVVRCGINLPVSGGGYFRLLPVELTIRALQAVNLRERRPFMFYIHPWELDPEQPRLPHGSFLGRRRHYVNLHTTKAKLERLLTSFHFGTVTQVARAAEHCETRSYVVGRDPYCRVQLAVP